MFATEPVWGDGFAEDGWLDIVRARSLEACADDELIRFFSNSCSSGKPAIARLRAIFAARLELQARRRHRLEHLAQRRLPSVLVGRLLGVRRDSRGVSVACEDRALAFLSDVIPRLDPGIRFDAKTATTFAFHAGLHPAYIWPEALVSHERETAAGWLGLLCRGRPALLARDVACYLDDFLEPHACRSVGATDETLRGLLCESRLDLKRLKTSVDRSLRGSIPIVRRGLAPPAERGERRILVAAGSSRARRFFS